MSSKSRYQPTTNQRRRRRGAPAAGVGAIMGGAIAAALLSTAIAHADVTGAATVGSDADPFADLFGSNATTQALDTVLATESPFAAFLLDNVDDGDLQILTTGDIDPAEDLLPADPTTVQILDAADIDLLLSNTTMWGNLGATLDAQIDAGTTAIPPVTDTEPDLFEDMLGPNATAAQLGIATAADNTLDHLASSIPGGPYELGTTDDAIDAFTLPTGDADPFEDLLPANATFAEIAVAYVDDANVGLFVSPTDLASLDAQVDQIVADNDALEDLTQAFGSTGGTFIAEFEQLVTGAPITDSAVDTLIASMGLGPF